MMSDNCTSQLVLLSATCCVSTIKNYVFSPCNCQRNQPFFLKGENCINVCVNKNLHYIDGESDAENDVQNYCYEISSKFLSCPRKPLHLSFG